MDMPIRKLVLLKYTEGSREDRHRGLCVLPLYAKTTPSPFTARKEVQTNKDLHHLSKI